MNAPPPPDAGMSILGVYGLQNPMVLWLLNRRPDLLAETPQEFMSHNPGTAPICGWAGELDLADIGGPPGFRWFECSKLMAFRYVDGRPAWVCFGHGEIEDGGRAKRPYHRFIERPPAKLNQEPSFNLWEEIGHAIAGRQADLVFDDGRWQVRR